jgi:hypothetical protein
MTQILTIEEQINEFLLYLDKNKLQNFILDVLPLFELYDIEENADWVAEIVGDDAADKIRLIRTVYLMSKIAALHGPTLKNLDKRFRNLYLDMEKAIDL